MRINQNITAFNAYRNLSSTNTVLGKSLEKLSSGYRINRAADDAAGLVISQGLRAQVSGLRQAVRNSQDGISVVQTAEGALNEVHSMLNRMRDLAVQAANTGSMDSDARNAAQAEINQLVSEIDRIANSTKFGSQNLLDGSFGVTPTSTSAFDADGSVAFTAGATFEVSVSGGAAVTITVDGNTRTGADVAAYLQGAIRTALASSGNSVNEAAAEKLTVKAQAVGAGYVYTIENTSASEVDLADTGGTSLADLGFTDLSLTGVASTGATFQVGANVTATEQITISISDMRVTGGTTAQFSALLSIDVTSASGAANAQTDIDAAISTLSGVRGDLGAYQNRLESTVANLQVTTENLAASESRIRDADMALEMVSFTRHQIMIQAGTAMLAQANSVPQSVLRLLQ